jgi:hypothetical protein
VRLGNESHHEPARLCRLPPPPVPIYLPVGALSRLPADAGAFCTAEDRFGLVQQLPVTAAVTSVEFKRVVGSGAPFQFTTAPGANPLPITVNVKSVPPAGTLGGLSELIAGILTVKMALFDVTLPEVTVTVAAPAAVMRSAGTEAVTCVVPM